MPHIDFLDQKDLDRICYFQGHQWQQQILKDRTTDELICHSHSVCCVCSGIRNEHQHLLQEQQIIDNCPQIGMAVRYVSKLDG